MPKHAELVTALGYRAIRSGTYGNRSRARARMALLGWRLTRQSRCGFLSVRLVRRQSLHKEAS